MKKRWKTLAPETHDAIVRLAWHDRTTFDEIAERFGLAEDEVIALMRASLKPGSFRAWRKRVAGRVTKHRKPLELRLSKRREPIPRDGA